MEVDDFELLELVNDYQERSDEPTFNTLDDIPEAMKAYDYFDKMPVVSEERIREELTKCFKCNSSLTLGWLSELTDLRDYIFKNTNLWLKPTSEK
jgi:hypothetical protein